MANDKVYLPRQHTRRGVAGYRGRNVVVVDDKGKERKELVQKPKTDEAADNAD